MRINLIRLLTTVLLCLFLAGANGQAVITTAGSDASGNGGSMSISYGLAVYTTTTGTTGSVAQGVQQPYEISVITEITDGPEVGLYFRTYPNPTDHSLTLRFEGKPEMEYRAAIYDASGRLCIIKTVTSNETSFDLSTFVTGTYILKLSDLNREVKTFKIVKN
ncbi:MAG: hypothetical protein FD166_3256 [Bacteroidetes bacterium]|nr:MAG: hypothetical protein FD166_3256 [Bacteroidota bacterium]